MTFTTLLLAENPTDGAAQPQQFDWTLILMLGVLALFMIFMWRSNKKRQSQARELQSQVQVGVEVMTNFGLFGTVYSIDEDENTVELETSPGNIVKVHRQTIGRVINPPEVNEDEVDLDSTESYELPEESGETKSEEK